jgi:hypothetical protein
MTAILCLGPFHWMMSTEGGEHRGGKVGRGSPDKTPFVAAVSTNDEGHPLYMNLQVVNGFRCVEIVNWSRKQLAPGSTVCSEGLTCFGAITAIDCQHVAIITGGGPDSVKHGDVPGSMP